MGLKYERYTTKFKRRRAELPYREVKPKNLRRLGDMVLQCMDVAGDTALPDQWEPLLKQLDKAYSENPQHLVVVLWRVLCNFTLSPLADSVLRPGVLSSSISIPAGSSKTR